LSGRGLRGRSLYWRRRIRTARGRRRRPGLGLSLVLLRRSLQCALICGLRRIGCRAGGTLVDLLHLRLYLLNEHLQSGGIIGVEQHLHAVEKWNRLRVNPEFLQGLIQLGQLLLRRESAGPGSITRSVGGGGEF
jgi:hypothetical protein